MKYLTTILLMLLSLCSINAQDSSNTVRLGVIMSIDQNLSPTHMPVGEYTGYSAEYDKFNYRLGVKVEREWSSGFTLNAAVIYSNKDFTGTYYCQVCDFSGPIGPQEVDFRFMEVPLSLRYYFLPDKLRIFGELGINNQFSLNQDIADGAYALGVKSGGGVEYNFNREMSLQLFVDYHKGMTNLINDTDFKINYIGFGAGLLKRL